MAQGLNNIPGGDGAILREQRFKTMDKIAEIATENNVDDHEKKSLNFLQTTIRRN
ncbi:hypothetical protein [Desulfonatronovibrio magnus]|uniref:hypothetical protein n=1 Tax=Desulfonatronovibrio magnus TaxID=698827 RepID=UPI0012FBD401|nr:hypothetical protein [Desulfonatronovibrio magnus]